MYNRKYTPKRISELKENEIFVFGSNLDMLSMNYLVCLKSAINQRVV